MERGVVVASDSNSEWLLSWWWERYSSCNTLPVVFVDLGMTSDAIVWCKEKGEVIVLNQSTQNSSSQLKSVWFKKPSACLLSPFTQTLWLDLDCEVLSFLDPVFDFLIEGKELVVSYGHAVDFPENLEKEALSGTICNSGVLVFRKGSELMRKWEKKALEESDLYVGDECILSILIGQSLETVGLLPEIYNWRMCRGMPLYTKIIHWKGEWGKRYILQYGGLKSALPQLFC